MDPRTVETAVAEAQRRDWARVLATVARHTRDLEVAEDAVAHAFAAALEAWRRSGIPREPAAWLTTVARRKALDLLRSEQALARRLPLLLVPTGDGGEGPWEEAASAPPDPGPIDDQRLRLVFTCCHPALAAEARVALTLRLVCGLEVPEIARMFLVSQPTMAARLTRAKRKIRAAGIAFQAPTAAALPQRLAAVLGVVYLVYTEGHTATRGPALDRPEHARRALELARLLQELLPQEPEVLGLLALLVLSESRRGARLDPAGRLVSLEHQDRGRWDREAIAEGVALLEAAARLSGGRATGPYTIQAAIAAVHAEAASPGETDWPQILALYEALLAVQPSPVAALGRAVAVAMVRGAQAGLEEIDRLAGDPRLARYHLLAAARADLLQRLGRREEAAGSFLLAASMTANPVEQEYLRRRAAAVEAAP